MSKIAVITPTIPRRSSLLEECRESVREQNVGVPFEHFVGEDTHGAGCATFRNGIVWGLASDFDWLAFLDDDDTMLPDHLRLLFAASENADIVYSDCETVGWKKSWESSPFNSGKLFIRNFIPVTVLMRRSLFDSLGGFRSVFAEDWDLWKRSWLADARFAFVPEVTWLYRRIDQTMLTTGKMVA